MAFGKTFLPRNGLTPFLKRGHGEDVEQLDGDELKIRI